MAQNDFKSFAVGAGANVISQAEWEALAALITGFQSGKASSAQINKAIRQASFIAAALAQYTSDKTGDDVLDDGDQAAFITKMAAAFGKDFQSLDATLTALAALTGAANKLAYFNGNDTAALTDLTAFARTILAQPDAASVNSALGISGRLKQIVTITSSGTYTPSSGTSLLVVEGVGGGGGGGGAGGVSSGASVGGGGGGGGYFLGTVSAPASSYSVTVGSGGTAGTSGSTAVVGGNGGATVFGSLFTAGGGSGGQSYATSQAGSQGGANGGASGSGTGGLINVGSDYGGYGMWPSSSIGFSGKGGNSKYGNGGAPGVVVSSSSQAGNAGTGYGTGGSGAWASGSGQTASGGVGKSGIIVVYEYY